ncbi:MAG: tRNA (adenosine(37)-N6)-threonylcarbamoyltransferase complex ATPase subunit type 1 TsaE [Cytophagales bacterium]|nr:tRNA (adenosine(37)-N6)-threonylcarbamoyltransferase complex ATPase subunit type 1 TsaE [Cytophagales bacterium]
MQVNGKILKVFDHVTPEDLPAVAERIIALAGTYKVWLFEGDMGTGKTTLIRALCKVFGIIDDVSSPTFALVNEYVDRQETYFYHFDFYRINNEEEAMDIGADEYFYSGNVCFIEWPEKIPALIPDEFLRIFISINSDNTRKIVLETV